MTSKITYKMFLYKCICINSTFMGRSTPTISFDIDLILHKHNEDIRMEFWSNNILLGSHNFVPKASMCSLGIEHVDYMSL